MRITIYKNERASYMNLDKILQDALEYEKIRDATTGKTWSFRDNGFDGCGDITADIHTRPLASTTAGWCYAKEINDTTQYLNARNGEFIAAAKNYDSPKIIRDLVERVKELEAINLKYHQILLPLYGCLKDAMICEDDDIKKYVITAYNIVTAYNAAAWEGRFTSDEVMVFQETLNKAIATLTQCQNIINEAKVKP